MAVPLRTDFYAATLRRLARGCSDNRQIRRLLALAAVYDGMSRTQAAKIGGIDRQTLPDWVHRFNAQGPDGLIDRAGAGRPRLLSDEQMAALLQIVETGPDPAHDGVVRWRRIDLVRVIPPSRRHPMKSDTCAVKLWRSRRSSPSSPWRTACSKNA